VTAFEQLVIDALERIERKTEAGTQALADHAETDRVAFGAIQSSVDSLMADHVSRKRAAQDAGAGAGGTAGRWWGGFIAAALLALAEAAKAVFK
jgi:hypothetical protein